MVIGILNQTVSTQPSMREFNYSVDMPAIDAILHTEWQKLFGTYTYDAALVTTMFKKRLPGDLRARAAAIPLHIKVLKLDQETAGFITYYFNSPATCHIELVAIKASCQSRGYGTFLIKELANSLQNTACKMLELYVFTNNPHAVEFYQRLGFSTRFNQGSYLLMDKPLKSLNRL